MHRVKGLKFDRMILVGMSEDNMPWTVAVGKSEDDAVRAEAEKMERALFYVAITRGKRDVLITASGEVSSWDIEVSSMLREGDWGAGLDG